jgi:antirestriction protein
LELFPVEKKDVQALLARSGVDGVLYEETFITDYETDVDGLCRYLGEYESVDELNYLAELVSEMDESEVEKLEAAIEHGEYNGSVKDLINLTQNLDCYEFYPDINNEEDLGYLFIDEYNALDVPEHIKPYFDYEAYGRGVSLDSNSTFTKGGGYVEYHGDFTEHYSGRDDLPEEHKIFAYPDPPSQMPVKQQLEMYANMILALAAAEKPTLARDERK